MSMLKIQQIQPSQVYLSSIYSSQSTQVQVTPQDLSLHYYLLSIICYYIVILCSVKIPIVFQRGGICSS